MSESTVTCKKRRSKEYKQYILDVIKDYNTNGKITVLLTCDTYLPVVDGVVNVVDNYAKELSKLMNVMLLVPDCKGNVYMDGAPAIGIMSSYSKKLQYQVPLPMLSSDCKRYLNKLRIDLIHCHSPFTVGRVAMKLHKQRDIPLITTFHSLYKYDFQKYASPFVNFMLKYIVKCYDCSNEVWTMNNECVNVLHEYGYHGKTFIIPNGIDSRPLPNYEEVRRVTRAKYVNDDNKLLFVFVGRLVAPKNIHFIVDVLANLKEKGLDFKMLFVGDGPERQQLEKHIATSKLNDNVAVIGSVRDTNLLNCIYAASDLMLFPSYYDTFALVKVEAASQNTPTAFIENCPACSDITNGVNGFIFPHDVEKFADGIYQAVQNRDKLREIGTNAKRDLYVTWEDIISKVYCRYNEVIQNSKNKQ